MNTAANPWADDDYTAPGETVLRSYCEEEPEPDGFEPAEIAWFAPTHKPCGVRA